MTLSNTAKSTCGDSEQAKCDLAGQTGRSTADRLERITIVEAIVAEGDQLDRQRVQDTYYSVSTLRHATEEELKLICSRLGIFGELYEKKALIIEILNVQTEKKAMKQEARKLLVEQAHERISRMTERLRELLPPGVRIGDYLQAPKHEQTKRQRSRPAARIH